MWAARAISKSFAGEKVPAASIPPIRGEGLLPAGRHSLSEDD
jgi:hypothetical protein